MTNDESTAVTVLRCDECGDTFPIQTGADQKCPSCGGTDLHPAAEPLL